MKISPCANEKVGRKPQTVNSNANYKLKTHFLIGSYHQLIRLSHHSTGSRGQLIGSSSHLTMIWISSQMNVIHGHLIG